MKTIIATAVLLAITLAEPPPSNSYLPPPAAGRSGGYPSGGPQGSGVIAARSGLEHGDHGFQGHGSHGHAAQGNGFARSGLGGHGSLNGLGQSAFGRNGLEDSGEPANYNFGYMVSDFEEGTDFGHHEERQDERAEGEYHVVLPDGRKQTVSYEADERGFKPHISYEDTDVSGRAGGYDSNANNARSFGNGGHGNHGNARSNGY
ncbi:pro-resilin-like [Leguminivora glycinivorella]|uniref:pro-resilin-like n=1 Tax=Leguminivora glycinivorella TaxID=1035111 RepID=UPI00200DF084|nr:pro-resilin-like [Leguminivora glycinivorella]